MYYIVIAVLAAVVLNDAISDLLLHSNVLSAHFVENVPIIQQLSLKHGIYQLVLPSLLPILQQKTAVLNLSD